MAICKFCAKPMQWGRADDRWVPLQPIGDEGDQPRTHMDENGVLRAAHRPFCNYASAVRVVQLSMPVQAADIMPVATKAPELVGPPKPKRKYRRKSE